MKVHNKYHDTAPADAVYIGRGSKYGNPYVRGKDGTREEVIAKHKDMIVARLAAGDLELVQDLLELNGKDLVCFCSPRPCHGDTLVEIVNLLNRSRNS